MPGNSILKLTNHCRTSQHMKYGVFNNIRLYQFHATGLFLHLLKTSQNLEFSGGLEKDQWHKMG